MANTANWTPVPQTYDPLKAGSIDGTDTRPHDRAIIRAMSATYQPNKSVVGDPKCTIFVGRLHPNTSEDTIRKVFSQFGEIRRHRLIRDLVTGFSKRYAFVEYQDQRSAYKAMREANKMHLDGCEIFVDFECERSLKGWVPRRLGGGFGGRKESGQLRYGGKDRPFRKPIVLPNLRRKNYDYESKNRYERGRQFRNIYNRNRRY